MVTKITCHFAPALIGHIENVYKKDKRLSWWNSKESYFTHPYLLKSAFYGLNFPNYRQDIDFEGTMIADSGGYEILSHSSKGKVINISPIEICNWQNNNADAGIILDTPPVNLTSRGGSVKGVDEQKFFECLSSTFENAEIWESNSTINVYNVLHGGTSEYNYNTNIYNRLNTWYNALSQYKFYGWAVAPKQTGNPIEIATYLLFLLEKGITKNVHILGISGWNIIPIIAYMSKYIDNITFDSITYGKGAIYKDYIIPLNVKQSLSFGNRNRTPIQHLPCTCPVCKMHNVDNYFEEGSISGALISLHNLYQMNKFTQFCFALKDDKEQFLKFIQKQCSNNTIKGIEFIDKCIKQNLKQNLNLSIQQTL